MTWGCFICRNRKNKQNQGKCSSCGMKKPEHKFCLAINGVFYLCSIHSSSQIPSVIVLRIGQESDRQLRLALPLVDNDLKICAREAITSNIDDFSRSPSPLPPLKPETDLSKPLDSSRSTSLFDQVLSHAAQLSYDGSVGTYVRSEANEGGGLQYIKNLERERVVMHQVVESVIKKRADLNFIDNSQQIRASLDKESRVSCALCEFDLPSSQLVGLISYGAIKRWRDDHNVTIDAKTYGLKHLEAARICIFCNQFFDEDFGDILQNKAEEEIQLDSESTIRGQVDSSITSYRKLLQGFLKQQSADNDRPMSRMERDMALSSLKMKKDASSLRIKSKKSDFVDIDKGGSFLREKYCNVS